MSANDVSQSGSVTPRHFAVWTTAGVIQDAGDPRNPLSTSGIGILSSNTTSFNIANAAITGPYNALSFGVTSAAANLTLGSFNGASDIPFNIIINGNVIPFPGTGGPFLPLSGGTMLGAVDLVGVSTAPTAAPGTNTDQIATTAFVVNQSGTGGPFLPLAGGTMAGLVNLVGISTAITASLGTNTDQIATTAFVIAQAGVGGPFLPLSGGTLTGLLLLHNIPTSNSGLPADAVWKNGQFLCIV